MSSFRLERRASVVDVVMVVALGLLVSFQSVSGMQNLSVSSNNTRLYVGSTLLSEPNKYFELGIFQFQTGGSYFLCIRFALPPDHAKPVWVLRDVPLKSARSHLTLSSTGSLQLFDDEAEGRSLWSTGTNNASIAALLDGGNLVLEDSRGNRVWNSFNNSMSDTLLPGQYLKRSDANQNSLVSWLSRDNPAAGKYIFTWGNASLLNGTTATNVLLLKCQTCAATNGSTTGRVFIPAPDVDSPHIISSADSVYFHPTLGGLYFPTTIPPNSPLPPASTLILSDFQQPSSSTHKRLTLDTDGGLRIWHWKIGELSEWTPEANWVVNERGTQCAVMNTCGSYGLCQMTPSNSLHRVQCSCPVGFRPLDNTDFSKGCEPKMILTRNDSCGFNFQVTMLEGFDLPWQGDLGSYINVTDFATCNETCWTDCDCSGIVFSKDEQRCWKKTGNKLTNLGYPTLALHGNDRRSYIKISIHQPIDQHSSGSKLWILAPVLGGVFLILIVACIYAFWKPLSQHCGGMRTSRKSGPSGTTSFPVYSGPE